MRIGYAAVAAFACVTSGVAHAQSAASSGDSHESGVTWHYLYDGGMLPFFYVPMAVALGVRLFADPPPTPRLFSATEGGAPFHADTVPESAVALYAVTGAAAVILLPTNKWARLYHLKGYGEAMMTNAMLTEVAKVTFGRHRPHWMPGMDADSRSSFFSGHSSFTFATSTYLGLYLHGHVFSKWRDPGQSYAWWETLPLGVLAGGSVAVAASRVHDNRHHPSDVITGAAVGTSVSAAFYLWQDSRYRRSAHLQLVPSANGLSLAGSW
jgi:PAP2 superfamily